MIAAATSYENESRSVIVIGGCHVTGWQIGENPRFWSDAAKSWNGNANTDCHGPSSLDRSSRLLEQADAKLPNTLLILQLGNFEASSISAFNPLIKPIISKFKKPASALRLSSIARSSHTLPALCRKSNLIISTKGLALLGIELLFPSKRRHDAIASLKSKFALLLDIIQSREPEKVVVLSTFPTASPIVNFYRKQLNKVIRELATSRSFVYIDAFQTVGDAVNSRRVGYRSLFADGFHFSAAGHSIISDEIKRRIS